MSQRSTIPPVLVIGVSVAIASAFGYWYAIIRGAPTNPLNVVEQVRGTRQDFATDPQKRHEEDLAQLTQITLAGVENDKTLELAGEVLRMLDTADAEAKRWNDEVVPLLTNESGRRLAAEADLVDAFRRNYSTDRPSVSTLTPVRRGAEQLKGQVATILTHRDTAYMATKERAELTEELHTAERFVDAYRVPREQIATFVRQATQRGRVASTTLAAAIQARADADAQASLVAENKRRAAATAAEEAKKDELARQAAQADQSRLATAAAAAELRRKAEDQAVQGQFLPFLAKGRYCGGPINNPYFLREDGLLFDYPRPMSYHCLSINDHVLTDYGAFMNLAQGRGNDRVNDRPRWPVPRSDDENREYYRRFQLFQQLAPLWQEMGVLSR